MGWALHFFPFFLMARQLFLHHYHPALWFAILSFCGTFDLVTSSLRPRIRLYTAGVFLFLAIYTFLYFSPLSYGSPWTKGKCEKAKWLKTWELLLVSATSCHRHQLLTNIISVAMTSSTM